MVSGRPAWPASAEPQWSSYSTWGQKKTLINILVSSNCCENSRLSVSTALTWSRCEPPSWGRRWWRGFPKTAGKWWFSRGSALRGASRRTQRCVASGCTHCAPLHTHTHLLIRPTFSDLPVVAQTPTQGHGDGWKVGHVVAVAVHAAVAAGTNWLWGHAGAVESRVRDASTCSAAAVAARRKSKRSF